MDTATLIRLVQQCKDIAFHEGGGSSSGDMSVAAALLIAALSGETTVQIKNAILRYEKPKENRS